MTRLLKAINFTNSAGKVVSIRCPGCRQLGTWESLGTDLLLYSKQASDGFTVGSRRCPNPSCRTHIFVVFESGNLLLSYPQETIDFDTSDIPTAIISAIQEAITCHSDHCYVASAIMVRKALEELCRDQGAKGANLKERIRDLGSKVVLPEELLSGLDDIRLLGNDAAHIESQVFSQVGREELDVAIEFTKEVLKALFQYTGLLQKLRALKK